MDGATEVRRLIDEAGLVLIVGHASPDGDCVGAMLALGHTLDHLGKPRSLVIPDRIPEALEFLPAAEGISVAPVELPPADLIIVPDCSDLGRLGSLYEGKEAFFSNVPVVNIDHHVSNRLFGTVNLVDTRAAAVCEQLFYLIPALGAPIDLPIATCLLTGLVTDTQTFRTPNTTSRSMRVATALFEAGAPLGEIADRVYNSRPLPTLRLWGLALTHLREADGIVWTHLDEEMLRQAGTSWEESEPLVNLLSSVRSARAVLLFKVMPDGIIRVSLRSNGWVNVADVAAYFGGGGHAGAAGCSLTGNLDAVERLVVDRLRDALAALP